MPLQNVTYFTPFATTNHEMLIEIFDKLNTTLPALRDSWAAQNMVPLSSLITDSYDIYANFQVTGLDSLKNKRINAPGTSANWLRETGATPVDGALTTYYTNIQTGVTQGALSFASGIAVRHACTRSPSTSRAWTSAPCISAAWRPTRSSSTACPRKFRRPCIKAGQATSIAHGKHVSKTAAAALETMKAAGLQISELPAAEKAKWVNGLPNIVAPWLQAAGEPGKQVLQAYFGELRARGVKPLRDWDQQNR